MKKVYLASPLHTDELKARITKVVTYLREEGNSVYSPMELKIPNAWDISNHEWAKKVYDNDVKELTNADLIVLDLTLLVELELRGKLDLQGQ